MEGKPENVIESKKYIEPHTFESDREAVLFYSYIEAHEYIKNLHSELEKARELIKGLEQEISDLRDAADSYRHNMNQNLTGNH